MSEVFFKQLDIPTPDRNLEVGSGDHGAQTGAMLAGIESVLKEQRSDRVLVYGDTNSTLAGALAAIKVHVPVAHVEAGLRSYDRRMPEEVNRVLADHVSDLLLCPTETAVANLLREGLSQGVKLTGDVMYDAFVENVEVARRECHIVSELELAPGAFHLMTVHRAENTDDPQRLRAIFAGVGAAGFSTVLPLHPRTRAALGAAGLAAPANLRLIDPVGYLEMLALEDAAELVVTD